MPIKHRHDYAICVICAHDRATHLSVAPSDDVRCPRRPINVTSPRQTIRLIFRHAKPATRHHGCERQHRPWTHSCAHRQARAVRQPLVRSDERPTSRIWMCVPRNSQERDASHRVASQRTIRTRRGCRCLRRDIVSLGVRAHHANWKLSSQRRIRCLNWHGAPRATRTNFQALLRTPRMHSRGMSARSDKFLL
jgi:hypothetical protein